MAIVTRHNSLIGCPTRRLRQHLGPSQPRFLKLNLRSQIMGGKHRLSRRDFSDRVAFALDLAMYYRDSLSCLLCPLFPTIIYEILRGLGLGGGPSSL